MALSFEFAFLGPEHNYVASLTKTTLPTCPLDPAETAFFRMPQKFQENFNRLAKSHYMYGIRGHDFLSYAIQATNMQNLKVLLRPSQVIVGEMEGLQKLAAADGAAYNRNPELTVSFGPSSGSFFADAPRLKRYRWANLPSELDDALQGHICRNGYGDAKGKIKNVCMNSQNGWIMQVGRDNQVIIGGKLPAELENVLKSLGKKKPFIKNLVLNHQHPSEYVLVLDDGTVYCRLHPGFEAQLHQMLKKWAEGNKLKLKWKLTSPGGCTEEDQRVRDAFYYSQRGWSHLQRENFELAYEYFKEAHTQDMNNDKIRKTYAQSLIKLRSMRKDQALEDHLARGQPLSGVSDRNAEFRYQYVFMLDTIKQLERREMLFSSPSREWSWVSELEDSKGKSGPQELDLSPISTLPSVPTFPAGVAELEAA